MIAVLACKLCRSLIRLLGRGGTDFPGCVALNLCPNLLGELAKNVTTVIVTGTNGKTTTSRMIEQSWQDAGISYFANKSGANLLSGVTAEFAVHFRDIIPRRRPAVRICLPYTASGSQRPPAAYPPHR